MSKKILMLIAPENFRDEEYFEPKEIFEENDFEVVTASKPNTSFARGKHGGEAVVDINFYKTNPSDYLGLVIVGGNGCTVYQKDKQALDLIKEFFNQKKLISAICLGPTILALAGVLNGISATVYNKDGVSGKLLEENGARFINHGVIRDKNIITASGAEYSQDFAYEIVEYFSNQS